MTTQSTEFRASAPSDTVQDQLGPLAELPGTWVGKGFNLISLPLPPPRDPHVPIFRLKLNAIHETLTFASTGVIPNRGFTQPDISFFGLHYLQQISDAETNEGLHIEPGLWLNLPAAPTDPPVPKPPTPPWHWSVARLGTIPHGDALFAQGPYRTIPNDVETLGTPVIGSVDSTPFTLDSRGNRKNISDDDYLAPFKNTPLPPGIPDGAIANPNLVLTDAIQNQNIVESVELAISAAPVGDINIAEFIPTSPNDTSNILNIPFVVANASASSFAAIFWIETVQNSDGSKFLQLQYTQTVILEFSGVLWPHISVATLVKR